MKAGQHNPGHRYGCWGTTRGGTKTVVLPVSVLDLANGERAQLVAPVTTPWNDIQCGHDFRHSDVACTGCTNLGVKDE